jgi:hypothetical protein
MYGRSGGKYVSLEDSQINEKYNGYPLFASGKNISSLSGTTPIHIEG